MDKRDRLIRLATFVLILVLGWLLYSMLITPKRRGINSLKQNLKNIEFQLSGVMGEEVTLRGGAMEAEQIEEHLKQLILQIPSERDVPKIIDKLLTKVGEGLSVDYSLIQPQKLAKEGRYKRLPIELKFATTYSHFNTYLTQLKAMPEFFRIDSLDMRRSPGNPKLVEIHLMLSGFVMPGEAEEKAEAIAKDAYPEVPKISPFTPRTITTQPRLKTSVDSAPAAPAPKLELQGIMQGEIKAAIINDHIVYVDDTIEGYRVLNIKASSVVLGRGKRTVVLRLK